MSPRTATKRRPAKRRSAPKWSAALLLGLADEVRENAYAKFSKFKVGAALVAPDGRVFTGCNVENSSFGLSICAERNAVWKAVSEGVRSFEAIAISAAQGASPCGACRQVLYEFAPNDLWVIWRAGGGRIVRKRLSQLLPEGFLFDGRKS